MRSLGCCSGASLSRFDTFETNFTNGQRNIFRQSWQKRADVSLAKTTQLCERYSLKYTFDIFNVTNGAARLAYVDTFLTNDSD